MNLLRSLSGMIQVELVSAEFPAAFLAITEAKIEICNVVWKDELTCRFQLARRQFLVLKSLVEKRGESLRICNRMGSYWKAAAALKRPVLIAGFLLLFSLTLFLPGRILFVQVDGNTRLPDSLILEAAEKHGVTFGVQRRSIRSEKIKNAILEELPQLQWAGINTSGCTATILVKERSVMQDPTTIPQASRIVAKRDGYILAGTVEQGTGMFYIGQTVNKGQLLISGYMDCDYFIRAVRAEGEIFAQTNREITAVVPSSCLAPSEEHTVKRKISLLFRKKRINLWKDSGISDATCGRMYKEYYMTLPGGFKLPIALCIDTYSYRSTIALTVEQTEADKQLRQFSQQYLQQLMVAGTVHSKSEQILSEQDAFVLRGSYVCEEMIGIEQPEEIGVIHGKDN